MGGGFLQVGNQRKSSNVQSALGIESHSGGEQSTYPGHRESIRSSVQSFSPSEHGAGGGRRTIASSKRASGVYMSANNEKTNFGKKFLTLIQDEIR